MSKASRLTLAFAASLAFAYSADIVGAWKMTADGPDGNTYKFNVVVKNSGSYAADLISDQIGTVALQDVAFKDDTLTFKFPYPGVGLIDFKLKLDADSLKGSLATPDGAAGPVTGTRDAAAPAKAFVSTTGSANVTGKWKLVAKHPSGGGEIQATLDLKQEGARVSGEIATDAGALPISDGKVDGSDFSFKIPLGDGTYEVKGKVAGSEYKGEYKGPSGGGSFVATKS